MSLNAPTRSNWILLIILGAIWGSSFMGVALSLDGFAPLQVAAIRICVAAIILVIYARLSGRGLPGDGSGPRIWLHVFGFAIFSNVLPFSLLSWGMQYVPSGFAGVTMAVVPLLVLPLAHFLVPGERMTIVKSIGFFAGFIGTLILIGPEAFSSTGESWESIARLACVAASASYAFGSITTRLAPPTGMISYAAATLVVAACLIGPYAVYVEGWPAFGFNDQTRAALYLAVFPTAIATLMMVQIIRTAGPSFLSLVNYQVPIWALIFGTVLLGEALPSSLILALALILGGIAFSQFASKLSTKKI